jgi:glycosyltransferase involved in cell wall biosynthesis
MASARLADAVVCVSRPSLDTIPESERARAIVIHNGVDPARVRASVSRDEQRRRWRIPPLAKVMGNVARVSEEKGTRAFAAALAHLPADWHGVWIGPCNNNEAPRWAMLELAQSLGVVGRLHLPGPTDDVGSALGAIDSFVMPSTEDAHAFAGIEAILAGVPIVATPLGVVAEHPELFRVLPRDPSGAAVARAVLADSATPDETAARVESARTFARSEWSREAFLRRWDALFDSIDLSAPGGAKAVAQPHVPGAAIRPVAARAKGG